MKSNWEEKEKQDGKRVVKMKLEKRKNKRWKEISKIEIKLKKRKIKDKKLNQIWKKKEEKTKNDRKVKTM